MNNFNEQKQKIVDFIVNGLIESDNGHDKATMAIKFNQMMTELQPEYPRCKTCTEYEVMLEEDNSGMCDKSGFVSSDYGCICHSSLGVKNE